MTKTLIHIKTIDDQDVRYLISHLENWEQNKAVKSGLAKAGEVFMRGGKQRLKGRIKRPQHGTGNLESSFRVRVKRVKAGVLSGFNHQGKHAHLVDAGTEDRAWAKNGKKTGRMKGNNFWTETKQQDGKKALDQLYIGIGRAVERINNRR